MSHWVKKETEVLNDIKKDILLLALGEIGKSFDEGINNISNAWGKERVDAALLDNGFVQNLGFNFKPLKTKDGHYKLELVGDFYGTGINENTFMGQLSHLYQKHNVLNALEDQNWTIEKTSINTEGELVIEAVQMA